MLQHLVHLHHRRQLHPVRLHPVDQAQPAVSALPHWAQPAVSSDSEAVSVEVEPPDLGEVHLPRAQEQEEVAAAPD